MVHRLLDVPRNTLNEKLNGSVFREGDLKWDPVPLKIVKVLYYGADDNNPYRYLLNGIHQASFAEWQLKLNEDIEEEVMEIRSVLDRIYNRKEKKYYYKLLMFGEKKTDAGFYERTQLVNSIGLKSVEELDNIYLDLQTEKKMNKK